MELGLNMASWYQPIEKVQWWYEAGLRTGTIITGAGTDKREWDFSSSNPETGLYFVSTTYKHKPGEWHVSSKGPPSIMSTGVLSRPATISSKAQPIDKPNDQNLDETDPESLEAKAYESLFPDSVSSTAH